MEGISRKSNIGSFTGTKEIEWKETREALGE